MSKVGNDAPAVVARLLSIVAQHGPGPEVPATAAVFDNAQVSESAANVKTFWPNATHALHSLARQDSAVGAICVLLDFAMAVHIRADEESAVAVFGLQEEAFQVLPLHKMRQMIAFLELRRPVWAGHAHGEAVIVLLRTGRTLLNRLEPRLHAWDTGRVIAYLALSKGIAHASRLNRKGLPNLAGVETVPSDGFSIEYAVNVLQNPAALAASDDLEPFLGALLPRLMRLTLENELADARNWATLTWEDAEKTLNGVIFVYVLIFALPALKSTPHQGALRSLERLEARVDKIVAGLDLRAVVERLAARESEWSTWRQQHYARPDRAAVELPAEAAAPASDLAVPPLEKSLGNENLTRLWSKSTGLARFEESVDWAARATEFEARAKDDPAYKFMALRSRPWIDLVSAFASAPVEEPDMTEWEAKLPQEQPAAPREPSKRLSEQPESAPKRARVSYEDVEHSSSVDRQRAMASTARPLPY